MRASQLGWVSEISGPSGDDHDLINPLCVHVDKARLRIIGAAMVEVSGLFLGERRCWIEVAYVDGALDVVLEAGPSKGEDIDDSRCAPHTLCADAGTRLSIDDQGLGFVVPPDRLLQRVELAWRKPFLCAVPDPRRLGDMGIAIEGRESLSHGGESLNGHGELLVSWDSPTLYRFKCRCRGFRDPDWGRFPGDVLRDVQ